MMFFETDGEMMGMDCYGSNKIAGDDQQRIDSPVTYQKVERG